MWIHEHKDWPNFTWNSAKISSKLAAVRHKQGVLLGRMKYLGFDLKIEATLRSLTDEIVKSSAIEGQVLNIEEVRSSIAKKIGIELAGMVPVSRYVEGVVDMMLDATQNYLTQLTKERLCGWHATLFPTGHSGMNSISVAKWRTQSCGPMQVVSGPIGKERIHFEAPSADRLDNEMNNFLVWFNTESEIDPVLKAGIAHFWFLTIHPFEDGNGRIARAIADMLLAKADASEERFYSLSSQIEAERNSYYEVLERQQRATLDLTVWVEWFLDCLGRAISNANSTLEHVIYKSRLWEMINLESINSRQRLVIIRMLDENFKGYINTSKYAKLAKCSLDTALRDIQQLKKRGILIQNPGAGRSTSYRLNDLK